MLLFTNAVFALFVIIALGYLLGRVSFRGFSFDISAVIFVALLFGHLGVELPDAIERIGMVLFIFTVGIQAGPGFIDSFRKRGRSLVLLSSIIVLSGGILSFVFMFAFKLQPSMAIGLMCGALTSTPGLTVATEATGSPLASIAYSIAYPFGVLGVILFVRLSPKFLGIDVKEQTKRIESEERNTFPLIENRNFRIIQSPIVGKTLKEIMEHYLPGISISRISHKGEGKTPTRSTILEEGDLVKAVGTPELLDRAKLIVGPVVDEEIRLLDSYTVQQVLVTNKSMVNRTLDEINLLQNFDAVVTRVRRSGIDITPSPDLHLRFGDKLMVACQTNSLEALGKMLGNDEKHLSDTDFLPIALGISLGILLGFIQIPILPHLSIKLGITGGVLLTAIALSAIGRTGSIVWTMSGSANQMLRELGMLLFLAGVGTNAGKHIVETVQIAGPQLLVMGLAITLIPMLVALLANRFIFKLNIFELMGAITGGMTSTPGLTACNSLTSNNIPDRAYAAVYPVAMVLLIIMVQIMSYMVI
jgi:putative transport protein